MTKENPYNIKPLYKDKYYVYALCRPCGEVFYVGKGKGKRINHHFQDYHLKKSNSSKNHIIRKYGNSIKREILCYFDNEGSAYDYEEWLISYYGLVSEGGQLHQYAKTRNEYADAFSTIASESSQTKTTSDVEDLVFKAYYLYFTECENKYFICEELNLNFDTLRSWVTGRKHKILYEKYITNGIIVKNREVSQEFRLDKRYTVKGLREDRDRWVNGLTTTSEVSKKYGVGVGTILSLFYGQNCYGLFKDYSCVPEKYLKRKNKAKWLEDKI